MSSPIVLSPTAIMDYTDCRRRAVLKHVFPQLKKKHQGSMAVRAITALGVMAHVNTALQLNDKPFLDDHPILHKPVVFNDHLPSLWAINNRSRDVARAVCQWFDENTGWPESKVSAETKTELELSDTLSVIGRADFRIAGGSLYELKVVCCDQDKVAGKMKAYIPQVMAYMMSHRSPHGTAEDGSILAANIKSADVDVKSLHIYARRLEQCIDYAARCFADDIEIAQEGSDVYPPGNPQSKHCSQSGCPFYHTDLCEQSREIWEI